MRITGQTALIFDVVQRACVAQAYSLDWWRESLNEFLLNPRLPEMLRVSSRLEAQKVVVSRTFPHGSPKLRIPPEGSIGFAWRDQLCRLFEYFRETSSTTFSPSSGGHAFIARRAVGSILHQRWPTVDSLIRGEGCSGAGLPHERSSPDIFHWKKASKNIHSTDRVTTCSPEKPSFLLLIQGPIRVALFLCTIDPESSVSIPPICCALWHVYMSSFGLSFWIHFEFLSSGTFSI